MLLELLDELFWLLGLLELLEVLLELFAELLCFPPAAFSAALAASKAAL